MMQDLLDFADPVRMIGEADGQEQKQPKTRWNVSIRL
jgi:hypothetical protein